MNALLVLQKLFREVFDDETLAVTPHTSHADIEGWDSVAQVKLVLTVEEEFGLQFSEDEVSSMRTVGDFLTSVEMRHSKAA